MKATAKANQNAYLQTKVMTANPAELRLMLLDGAIRFAQQARDGLNRRDFDGAYVGFTRCQAILLELVNSLRPEHDPSLCNKLSALYTFMYTRLVTASMQRDSAMVDEVLKLLTYERETWSMLLDQLAAENRAAAKATELPSDVTPTLPADGTAVRSIVGGTVSFQG
jgi:flagellar secretion chaperone FliS